MWKTGPSPVVPFLMVGVLGLVVFGPTLMSLLEYAQPLIQMDDEGGFYPLMMMLPLLLLLLIHLISSCCPTQGDKCYSRPLSSAMTTLMCSDA
ncbi:hypothetical protein K2173_026508 [Erythroxylum novogranatense]|uniref:Uncharacterized protein n=1 Tax=Erythroxylum novogranatense TaxID=1862640 RepID=A0AAV8TXR4_9ROSI|nr:hypothetical protein K2173_026508 [Erythroxylum novogranatense]